MKTEEVKESEGFTVLRLHYSADPDKRAPGWAEKTRTSMQMPKEDWEREMELKAVGLKDSTPVFGDWDRKRHEDSSLVVLSNVRTIYRLWDFGKVHPCLEFMQVDGRKINLINEIYGTNVLIDTFAEEVLMKSTEFRGANFIDIGDASGENEKDTGPASIRTLKQNYHIIVHSMRREVEDGITDIQKNLVLTVDGRPALMANPDRCPMLVKALRGGYKRNKRGLLVKDNIHDHPIDCIRYGVQWVMRRSSSKWNKVVAAAKNYRYKPRNVITGY